MSKISDFSQVVLLHQCNFDGNSMRCNACSLNKCTDDFVPLHLAKKCLTDLVSAGTTRQIDIIGGEPAIYPGMFELTKFANNNLDIKQFNILTNAKDTDFLQQIKPFLPEKKIGLVVSVNYLPKTAEKYKESIKGMAAKSTYGWHAINKYHEIARMRVALVIDCYNLTFGEIPEITRRVCEKGVAINFCPLVYNNTTDGADLIFRAKNNEFAPATEHKTQMEELVGQLLELKNEFGDLIVTPTDYIKIFPDLCKEANKPYSLNCSGIGFPYARPCFVIGKSQYDGQKGMRLMACSDILGDSENGIHSLVASDLLIPEVREKLDEIYQNDKFVKECCEKQGCCWSVVWSLSKKIIGDLINIYNRTHKVRYFFVFSLYNLLLLC